MGSLDGRTAVVTGAGSGVGQGIALALAAEGARLCLVGRTAATLSGTAEAAGDRAETMCYVVDLMDDDGVLRLGEQLRLDVGPIDVLVHSAGVHAIGELATMPVAEVDRQYRTNVPRRICSHRRCCLSSGWPTGKSCSSIPVSACSRTPGSAGTPQANTR